MSAASSPDMNSHHLHQQQQQQQQQRQQHPELSPQHLPSFSLHESNTAPSVSSVGSPFAAASSSLGSPHGRPLPYQEGPSQFTSAMDLVERLQHQLKAVRLDKGRLEERCFILEREVNDIARNMQPQAQQTHHITAPPLSSSTTRNDSPPLPSSPAPHHHHHHRHKKEEERDSKARLATAEAQLKSRDKEVQALQERLQRTHASLREAESKYLSDLSRLFKESAHPDLDLGEREKWERELGQALREVNELKEEVTGLRAAVKEEKGGRTTKRSSPLRDAKREEEMSNLRIKVVRQAETIHADKKVIKVLKKAVREAQTYAQEVEGRLEASVEAQQKLKKQLLALAERYEGLMGQLREQVESMAEEEEEVEVVGRGEEGEEEEEEEGRRQRKAKKEKSHTKKRNSHKKEEEKGGGGRGGGGGHRHRRHHHHEKEEEEEQQARRRVTRRGKEHRRGGRPTPTPTPPPQAWEINFVRDGKEYEVSPLIHRFEQSER